MREFPNLIFNDKFNKELKKLLKGYSKANDFKKWLFDRLAQLNEPDFDYREYPKWFESIYDLYAITYRHKEKNIRIFYHVDNNSIKILLCCFDEKSTKSDYLLNYRTAKNILKNMR